MRTRVHIYPALFIPSSVLLNLFHFVWKDSSSARDKSVLSTEEKNRDEKLEPRWIRNILASRWISRKLSPKNDNFFRRREKESFFPRHLRIEHVSAVIALPSLIKKTSLLAKDFDTRALFPVFLSKQRTLLLWPHD